MRNVGIYEVRYSKRRIPMLIRVADTAIKGNITVDTADIAWSVLEEVFEVSVQSEEYVYLMCCDGKMHIIGLFIVSHGNVKSALINLFGMFQRTLLCNAVNIIVAHNHPSGKCDISMEDRRVFDKLQQACKIMEVNLQDNLILGNGEYLSFRKLGMINL